MKYNQNSQKQIIQTNGYNGSEPTRGCPCCVATKPLSEFGFRKMNKNSEIIRNQSWCKICRSKGNPKMKAFIKNTFQPLEKALKKAFGIRKVKKGQIFDSLGFANDSREKITRFVLFKIGRAHV